MVLVQTDLEDYFEHELDQDLLDRLPNLDGPESTEVHFTSGVSDIIKHFDELSLNLFHIRIHPCLEFNYEKFLASAMETFDYGLAAEELKASRRHIHFLVLSRMDIDDVRSWYKTNSHEKMTGNKFYSLAVVRKDLFTMIQYIIKPENKKRKDEKKYDSWNFPQEYILEARRLAYEKYDKKAVAEAFDDLKKRYLRDPKFGDIIYIRDYKLLKKRYNQDVNTQHLIRHVQSLRIVKDLRYCNEHTRYVVDQVNKIFDRING